MLARNSWANAGTMRTLLSAQIQKRRRAMLNLQESTVLYLRLYGNVTIHTSASAPFGARLRVCATVYCDFLLSFARIQGRCGAAFSGWVGDFIIALVKDVSPGRIELNIGGKVYV